MARSTQQESDEARTAEADESRTAVSTRERPERPVEGGGAGEAEVGTTEAAKAEVVASDEGDHVKMSHPASDVSDQELGEIFVGSVSKVSTSNEEAEPPDHYNAQCSLCAQSYDGEDQQEVTDKLNVHYKAAHVQYDGAGLPPE